MSKDPTRREPQAVNSGETAAGAQGAGTKALRWRHTAQCVPGTERGQVGAQRLLGRMRSEHRRGQTLHDALRNVAFTWVT